MGACVIRQNLGHDPPVLADDHRGFVPGLTTLNTGAITTRDEEAIGACSSLRRDHFGNTFSFGVFPGRPVRWNYQQICACKREKPGHLGELEVVANQKPYASVY